MADIGVIFDLDDTLYKEIEFLKSGFKSIVEQLPFDNKDEVYNRMLQKYQAVENAFDYINQLYPRLTISSMLQLYRGHTPDIQLNESTIDCLEFLKGKGIFLGLITDGRSETQRNKIGALGLDKFLPECGIVISEEIGSEKPSEKNYNCIANIHPGCRLFYVGDNPMKDFVTPNKLGWTTIGLRDNGDNIHSQICEFEEFEPQIWINDISEIKFMI